MARATSSAYEAASQAQAGKTVACIYMRIPKKDSEPQNIELFLCETEEGAIAIGAQSYTPAITRFPQQIKHALNRAPDGGEVSLENLTRTYGDLLCDPDRETANTYLLISLAKNIAPFGDPKVFEADPIMSAYMRSPRATNNEVTFNIVSDMQRRGAIVGGEQIAQHCTFVFNQGGNHPLGGSCDWQVAQGGDPLFCGHTMEDCIKHNNLHHYGGLPELKARAAVIGNPIDPGNGWDDGLYPRNFYHGGLGARGRRSLPVLE